MTASDGASAAPCTDPTTPAASASATASSGLRVNVTPSSYANGPVANQQLGDVASQPVDGQGNAISLNQTPAQAAASGNCTLTVPANPLTARGLATPYQLGDGCSMANAGTQGAFVEATILSRNGQVQVYNPLVITQGTTPAANPVPPTIQPGSEVILDFGFNGTNLVLTGPGATERSSGCVDADGQSVIGQVSACNAVPFYLLANSEIASGILKVPALGTATDGQACETTRDFALIDQDQSDNVVTEYLINGDGQTAQATAANSAAANAMAANSTTANGTTANGTVGNSTAGNGGNGRNGNGRNGNGRNGNGRNGDAGTGNSTGLAGATAVTNGSDDALLSNFVDPANGCAAFTAPDITSPGGTSGAQALNELSARVNQKGTIAVTPPNDEMTLVGGNMSIAKTNVYRSIVDQPLLASNVDPNEVAAAYCMNMVNIAPARDQADMAGDANFSTPVPATGNNLATFLGNRLSMSFTNLGCQNFGLTDPVNVTTDGNGVAIAVTYTTTQQQATLPAATTGTGTGTGTGTTTGHGTGTGRQLPPPRQGHGYRDGFSPGGHRRFQDPSGM